MAMRKCCAPASPARQLMIIEEKLIRFRAKATRDLINYPVRLYDELSTSIPVAERT
jgi:hypothetical protein